MLDFYKTEVCLGYMSASSGSAYVLVGTVLCLEACGGWLEPWILIEYILVGWYYIIL